MTNVTVVFEYEEPEYCRLCLSKETENNELTTIGEADVIGTIRELLQIQLDKTDSDAFICSTCVESLEEFYTYRTRCRRNDVTLQKKAEERKQRQIELAKSAIANTNVLDQVKDGEPIKVVIRMNAEGKASVRLQVQSKQPSTEESKPATPPAPATTIKAEPSTSTAGSSKVTIPADKPSVASTKVVPEKTTTTTTTKKLIRLPSQPFYFYRTSATSSYGLIYGGYRYYGSVPRKQRTYWMCEQRKSHRCEAVFLVDKKYTEFLLNCGHNHDPPQVRPHQRILKAADVLPDVIRKERVKEDLLAKSKHQKEAENNGQKKVVKEEEYTSDEYTSEEDSDEVVELEEDEEIENEEEEEDDDDEDESQGEPEATGDGEARPVEVAIKNEQVVDVADSMYIIQELT